MHFSLMRSEQDWSFLGHPDVIEQPKVRGTSFRSNKEMWCYPNSSLAIALSWLRYAR
jgi:hypothetical protein